MICRCGHLLMFSPIHFKTLNNFSHHSNTFSIIALNKCFFLSFFWQKVEMLNYWWWIDRISLNILSFLKIIIVKMHFSFDGEKESSWKVVFIDFLNAVYFSHRKHQFVDWNIQQITFMKFIHSNENLERIMLIWRVLKKERFFFDKNYFHKKNFFSGEKDRFHQNGNKSKSVISINEEKNQIMISFHYFSDFLSFSWRNWVSR